MTKEFLSQYMEDRTYNFMVLNGPHKGELYTCQNYNKMHGEYDKTIGCVNFTTVDYYKELQYKDNEYFNTELDVDKALKLYDAKYKAYLENIAKQMEDNQFSI